MVNVVCFAVKDLDPKHFPDHVESGVVETSHEARHNHEQDARERMDRSDARTVQINGQQMIVLPQNKLNGMHIDGVRVGATWAYKSKNRTTTREKKKGHRRQGSEYSFVCWFLPWSLLVMMVFVDQTVDGFHVESPVQHDVEKVVNDKETSHGEHSVPKGWFGPNHIVGSEAIPHHKENVQNGRQLVEGNKGVVHLQCNV